MGVISVIVLSALVAAVAASAGYLIWRLLDREELHALRDQVTHLENRLRELEKREEDAPRTS